MGQLNKSDLQLRLESQLKAKMRPDYEQLAQRLLEQRGHIEPGSYKLTTTGEEKNKLGAEGRALQRDGRDEVTWYDKNTNKVYR